jgi:hypothetical protein
MVCWTAPSLTAKNEAIFGRAGVNKTALTDANEIIIINVINGICACFVMAKYFLSRDLRTGIDLLELGKSQQRHRSSMSALLQKAQFC